MSDRLEKERELVGKKTAEAKRVLNLTPREHFNPMGFTWFQWLVASFGLLILLTTVAVLLRN